MIYLLFMYIYNKANNAVEVVDAVECTTGLVVSLLGLLAKIKV